MKILTVIVPVYNTEKYIKRCLDSLDNKEINVTPKEFEILSYFINNQNVAISREALLNKLWGYDYFGDDRTIDTHIKMLRNNLGEYRSLIKTVRGIGYKFEIK